VIPPLAGVLRERSASLAAAITERIVEEVPEVLPDPDAREANRFSNEASLLSVAELLEAGADPSQAELLYRIGHELAWELIVETLREQVDDPADRAAALDLVSRWLLSYVDVVTTLADESYTGERERWIRTAAAARTHTVLALLEGGQVDSESASRRLGYALDRWHVAAIAWVEPSAVDGDPAGALDRALAEVARAHGAERPLVHSLGVTALVAWIGHRGDGESHPAVDPAAIEPVRIASGSSAAGIDGFRRTYREAVEARRVATLIGAPEGSATGYEAIALLAMTRAPTRGRPPRTCVGSSARSPPVTRRLGDLRRRCASTSTRGRATAGGPAAAGFTSTRSATASGRERTCSGAPSARATSTSGSPWRCSTWRRTWTRRRSAPDARSPSAAGPPVARPSTSRHAGP
jgi:hypothetical protein